MSLAIAGFWVLTAILVDAFISYALTRDSHHENRNPERNGDGASAHEQTADHGATKPTIIKEHVPTSNEDQQNAARQKRDALDYAAFVLTCLTFIVLIVYTTINYWLYQATENNFVVSQQAFVFYSGIELADPGNPIPLGFADTVTGGVLIHFENSGATPAIDVTETSNVCVTQNDIENDFSYDRPDFAWPQAKASVAPRSTFSVGVPIHPELIEKVIEFKSKMFVWGTIKYFDIFHEPHITQFCEKYFTSDKTKATNAITVITEQCAKHNCSDKNCHRDWGYNDAIECENAPWTMPTPTK